MNSTLEKTPYQLGRLSRPFDENIGLERFANTSSRRAKKIVDKVTSLRQAEFDRRAMGPVPVARRIGDHRNARSGKGALRLSHAGFKTRWCAWARSDKIASSDRPSARDRRGGLHEKLSVWFVCTGCCAPGCAAKRAPPFLRLRGWFFLTSAPDEIWRSPPRGRVFSR